MNTNLDKTMNTQTTALFDKTGREVMKGDTLKIFHFIGARRKRHYMYQYVLDRVVTPTGVNLMKISHLSKDGPESHWHKLIDGSMVEEWEIVQGFAGVKPGQDFSDRPKTYLQNPELEHRATSE